MSKRPLDESEREQVRHGLLTSSLVVEAGAGTGKTSLLIDRLLSLVEQFDVTELAAITFTEKAAAELKDRFRRALERKIGESVGDKPDPQIIRALNEIDRARISTIHAFATAIIRHQPFEVGLEPDFQHLDEADELELLRQAMAERLSSADRERDDLLAQFLALGGQHKHLTELVYKLNSERELLPYHKIGTALDTSYSWFDELRGEVYELAQNARKYCIEANDPGRIQIERLDSTAPENGNRSFEEIYRWLIEVAGLNRNAGRQGSWSDVDIARRQKNALAELKHNATATLESIRTAVFERLIKWLTSVIDRVQTRKIESNFITFQDQLITAKQLLDNPALLRLFQDRFRRILIDEFQDTDPLQVELAIRLASRKTEIQPGEAITLEPGKLCLVGDPKQSIYRFRRADHRIYADAVEQILKTGDKVVISQNFRSAPGIIEFINGFFSPIWAELASSEVRYEPLLADPNRRDPEPSPPVAFIRQNRDNGECPMRLGEVRRAEGLAIAKLIQKAGQDERWQVMHRFPEGNFSPEPVGYGDIAVLMPQMTDIEYYTDPLADAGIPFNVAGGKGFYRRQIVRDLYHCLRAIDNPADKLAVIGALRSSFFGLSDAELVELKDKLDKTFDYREELHKLLRYLGDAIRNLQELYELKRILPIDKLIERLLETTDIIPALQCDQQNRTDLTALNHVLTMARAYETNIQGNLRGFCRSLKAKLDSDPSEDAPPSADDGNHVRLMTIHAAKGLEFPVVILANLNREREQSETVLADRLSKRLEIRIGERDDGFKTARFTEAEENEKHARQAEYLRLFYVALTRARDHLVLPCFHGKSPSGYNSWLDDFLNGSGLFKGVEKPPHRIIPENEMPDIKKKSEKELSGSVLIVESLIAERNKWSEERAIRLQKAIGSLPEITRPSQHDLPTTESERLPTEVDDKAAAIGCALHLYMSTCKPDTVLNEDLIGLIAAQENISTSDVAPLIRNCLESEQWKNAIRARRMWTEVPIMIKTDKGMMRGSIDLMWEDGEGGIHILDWKTGKFDPERHKAQIRDYAAAVTKTTGKPVASAALFFAADGITHSIGDYLA